MFDYITTILLALEAVLKIIALGLVGHPGAYLRNGCVLVSALLCYLRVRIVPCMNAVDESNSECARIADLHRWNALDCLTVVASIGALAYTGKGMCLPFACALWFVSSKLREFAFIRSTCRSPT